MRGFLAFLFSINGRVRRREFWLSTVVVGSLIVDQVLVVRQIAGQHGVYANTVGDGYMWNLLTHSDTHYAILALLGLIAFTIMAKRMHDRNRSGLWLWLGLVPVVGWAWLAFELVLMPGTEGANRYGPHPTFKPAEDEEPLQLWKR